MIRKSVTAGLSVCMATSGLLLVAPANASAPAAHAGKTSSTHYAMQASGYSTRVTGGGVPVSSGRTAFQVIGCTNKAGLSKQNSQADLNLSQLLNGTDISTATTHVWTRQKNGVVSSYANNHIAQVTIAGSALPTDDIVLTGINSRSRTWHDSKGFHASTKATLAGITVGGNTVPVPINGSVDLGLVTLTLGNSQKSHNRQGASAQLDALKLAVNLTNTKVYLAHSRSTIHAGVKSGLFHGSAYAAKAQALAGTVTVGRTPYIVMPCQGTNGKLVTRHVANVNPGLVVKGLSALQKSDQTGKSAYGHESGRVARVSLSKGTKALRIRGVVGKANVYYSRANGIRKDTKGSGIVSIRLNGKRLHLNAKGNLKIGNLVSLKSHIVKSTKRTIQITELRITLLGNGPNAGATVDLGYAKVGFSKSF